MMNNDKLIGKFISGQINKNIIGQCLDPNDIAAFIDNTLEDAQRDQAAGHLASCDKCYEIYANTVETLEELENHETKQHRQAMFKNRRAINISIAIGLAVAAMIVLIFNPFHEITPYESINIRIDDVVNNIETSISYIAFDTPDGYGFSSGISKHKQAFRYGAASVDLETALKSGDKDTAIRLLKAIIEMVQAINNEKTKAYEDMFHAVESNKDIERFSKQRLQIALNDKPTDIYILFGQWTEAGRIAAATKQTDYFNYEDIQYFLTNLPINDLPKGVIKSLNTIQVIVKSDNFDDKALKKLQSEFESLITLLS